MTRVSALAALAMLAALAAAGCNQTKTVVQPGELSTSVQFIDVTGALQAINVFAEKDTEGNIARVQAQVQNTSTSKKAWNLEYKVEFYAADNRALASTAKGWVPMAIGRGELATLSGATTAPGAVRATIRVREFNPKE